MKNEYHRRVRPIEAEPLRFFICRFLSECVTGLFLAFIAAPRPPLSGLVLRLLNSNLPDLWVKSSAGSSLFNSDEMYLRWSMHQEKYISRKTAVMWNCPIQISAAAGKPTRVTWTSCSFRAGLSAWGNAGTSGAEDPKTVPGDAHQSGHAVGGGIIFSIDFLQKEE